MNDFEFTTQYVSGMTKIPVRTIQVYVSAFREFFSEKAAQPVKGRRFLSADIDKLQTIQRLRAERIQDDEIKQILAGELPFKLSHQFSEVEIKNMAAHSLEIFGHANKALDKVEEVLNDATRTQSEARNLLEQNRQEMQSIRNQLNRIEQTLQKFRDWQLFVMRYDPALNPYDDEPNTEKGKGLFGKLLG
jgi:DNA-binding transcriptional MerR regulator